MKKTILLIGKNIKLTKLILANKTPVLFDENDRPCLEVVFDEKPILIKKVVDRSGQFDHLRQSLAGSGLNIITEPRGGETEHWYQLEYDNQVKTIRPQLTYSLWQPPEFMPDYLYISSSVWLADQDVDQICEYLAVNQSVKLIVEDSLSEKLLKRADLAIYQINSNDSNSAETKLRITKAHQTRRTVVIGRDQIWASDNQQIVKTNFKSGFPIFEIYGILIKIIGFDRDAEDLLGLFKQSMNQIENGQNVDFDNLANLKLDNSSLELISGNINFQKQLVGIKQRFLANKYPVIDVNLDGDGQSKLNQNQYCRLIEPMILTIKIEIKISALLLDSSVNNNLADIKLDSDLLIGMRFDAGFEAMPGFADEKITVGLDGLSQRLINFRQIGVRLAQWRCHYLLNNDSPSDASILSNAHIAARFTKLAQESGLLPIVTLEFSGFDDKKAIQIVESLLTEMKLFKVDLEYLAICFVSHDNLTINLSGELLGSRGVMVLADNKVNLASADKRFYRRSISLPVEVFDSSDLTNQAKNMTKKLLSSLSGLV